MRLTSGIWKRWWGWWDFKDRCSAYCFCRKAFHQDEVQRMAFPFVLEPRKIGSPGNFRNNKVLRTTGSLACLPGEFYVTAYGYLQVSLVELHGKITRYQPGVNGAFLDKINRFGIRSGQSYYCSFVVYLSNGRHAGKAIACIACLFARDRNDKNNKQ